MRTFYTWPGIAIVGVSLVGPACGEPEEGAAPKGATPFDPATYCQAAQDCADRHGLPFDGYRCTLDVEDEQRDAGAHACASELREYLDCLGGRSECIYGSYEAPACDDLGWVYEGCMLDAGVPPNTSGVTSFPTGTGGWGLAYISVECVSGIIEVSARASHPDGWVVLDMADTVHATAGWYEEHALLATGTGSFSASLLAESGYDNGWSSAFRCDGSHIEEPGRNQGTVMTYVVRWYDSLGLRDCFAVGQDPSGMLAGAYDDFGNQSEPADVNTANCTVQSWAR